MKGRLAVVAALASLLAFVALLIGWAHALLGDEVWVRFVGHSVVVHGSDGRQVAWSRMYFFCPPQPNDPTFEGPAGLVRLLRTNSLGIVDIYTFAGAELYVDASAPPTPLHRTLVVPVLYPLLLTAIPPAVWLATRLRKRRRHGRGLCPVCGYDLRATPGKCPECGATPPMPAAPMPAAPT